jgi:hypothetical protein
MFIISGN